MLEFGAFVKDAYEPYEKKRRCQEYTSAVRPTYIESWRLRPIEAPFLNRIIRDGREI